MHRLQEMLRLHRLGQGSRGIARQLRIGRDTIRCYLRALATAGVLEGPPDDLPDLDRLRVIVEEHVESKQAPQQRSSVERWRTAIVRLHERCGLLSASTASPS